MTDANADALANELETSVVPFSESPPDALSPRARTVPTAEERERARREKERKKLLQAGGDDGDDDADGNACGWIS